MSGDYHNPYAPAASISSLAMHDSLGLPDADRTKAEAIIKDAGQFWIAILLCFVCSGAFGMILIGPWYLIRMIQWNRLAAQYPQLIGPNAPLGSLQQRFQSSKWKLIIGLVVGFVLLLLFGMLIFVAISTARISSQQQMGN